MKLFRPGLLIISIVMASNPGGATVPGPSVFSDVPSKATRASEWIIRTIDDTTNVGPHLGVAYSETSNRIFISYYDAVNRDLWVAWSILPEHQGSGNCGPDNDWFCAALDTEGDVGQYNHIATEDLEGYTRVDISYYDETNHALKIMIGIIYHEGDAFGVNLFTIQTGDPTGDVWYGKHSAIVLDDSGQPTIAYQKGNSSPSINEEQMVARPVTENTGNCGEGDVLNDWQCDTIFFAEGVGAYASIDLDSAQIPSVAFYSAGSGQPVVANHVGSGGNCGPSNSWSCSSVANGTDDTGRFLSLFVEADGTPHLAYYNATDETLEYSFFVGSGGNCGAGQWSCVPINSMGTSLSDMGISMDHNPDDHPVIAYQDATSAVGPAVLAIARPAILVPGSTPNCGPAGFTPYTWVCEWLDSGGATLSEARAVSLKTNETGGAVIAYHEMDDYPYPAEGAVKTISDFHPHMVFSDGFEGGGFDSWSAVVSGGTIP